MKRLYILLWALLPIAALAESDFGTWESVSLSKDFGKQWSVGAEIDFRTSDFLKEISRTGIGVDADYKATRWLKMGAGYSFILDHSLSNLQEDYKKNSGAFNGFNEDAAFWRNKHRAYFDLTGKVKAGRFTLTLRERYQYTHFMPTTCERTRYRDPLTSTAGITGTLIEKGGYYFWPDEITTVTDEKSARDTHILRSKLGVEYNIRHCPVTPGVSYEIQNRIDDAFCATKQRITAGIEWKVNKKFFLSADYIYQHEFKPEEYEVGNLHAISIGAKIKL